MCQQCVDAIKRYWPHLKEVEWNDLLWGATAFPVGDGETVARQLEEMAVKSGGDLGKALAIADAETEAAMFEARKSEIFDDGVRQQT